MDFYLPDKSFEGNEKKTQNKQTRKAVEFYDTFDGCYMWRTYGRSVLLAARSIIDRFSCFLISFASNVPENHTIFLRSFESNFFVNCNIYCTMQNTVIF